MGHFANTIGTVWARSRGVLILTGGIALALQFLSNAPAIQKVATVALILGAVVVTAAVVTWASRARGHAAAFRLLLGMALTIAAGVAYNTWEGVPLEGTIPALIESLLLVSPFLYCLACGAVDGMLSEPSEA